MAHTLGTESLLDRRFLIVSRLGVGGMGRVFRAFDRVLDRVVAIKIPRGIDADGERKRRTLPGASLETEFRHLSRLDHPNVVRGIDFALAATGPLPLGTPYLVLEAFAGRPVHRALRPGRLSSGALRSLAVGLLEALDHVHRAGLVHRDLKPGNVLVSSGRDPAPAVKLTDFGLASEAGFSDEPGRISGSLPYVAPEAIVGGKLDGRTDLYGLGILLYYLSVGVLPFESLRTRDVLRWHLEGGPADPAKARPSIPRRFGVLIRRLTERDPGRRPRSVRSALRMLDVRGEDVDPLEGVPLDDTRLRRVVDRASLGFPGIARLGGTPRRRRRACLAARALARARRITCVRLFEEGAGGRALARMMLELLVVARPDVAGTRAAKRALRRLGFDTTLGDPVAGHDPRPAMSTPDVARLAEDVASCVTVAARRAPIVVVVEPGATRREPARSAVEALAETAGRLRRSGERIGLAVVLSRHDAPQRPPRNSTVGVEEFNGEPIAPGVSELRRI